MGMLMHYHLMAQRAAEAEAGKVNAPDESDRELVTKPPRRRKAAPTPESEPEAPENTEQSDQD